MTTPTDPPMPATVAELATELRRIDRLPAAARARHLRRLTDAARMLLSHAADAAVYEAVTEGPPTHGRVAKVARQLGVTTSAVSNATTRHRDRLATANNR